MARHVDGNAIAPINLQVKNSKEHILRYIHYKIPLVLVQAHVFCFSGTRTDLELPGREEMGRRATHAEAGTKPMPSAYALFMSAMKARGVSPPRFGKLKRRIVGKKPLKGQEHYRFRWPPDMNTDSYYVYKSRLL